MGSNMSYERDAWVLWSVNDNKFIILYYIIIGATCGDGVWKEKSIRIGKEGSGVLRATGNHT